MYSSMIKIFLPKFLYIHLNELLQLNPINFIFILFKFRTNGQKCHQIQIRHIMEEQKPIKTFTKEEAEKIREEFNMMCALANDSEFYDLYDTYTVKKMIEWYLTLPSKKRKAGNYIFLAKTFHGCWENEKSRHEMRKKKKQLKDNKKVRFDDEPLFNIKEDSDDEEDEDGIPWWQHCQQADEDFGESMHDQHGYLKELNRKDLKEEMMQCLEIDCELSDTDTDESDIHSQESNAEESDTVSLVHKERPLSPSAKSIEI